MFGAELHIVTGGMLGSTVGGDKLGIAPTVGGRVGGLFLGGQIGVVARPG